MSLRTSAACTTMRVGCGLGSQTMHRMLSTTRGATMLDSSRCFVLMQSGEIGEFEFCRQEQGNNIYCARHSSPPRRLAIVCHNGHELSAFRDKIVEGSLVRDTDEAMCPEYEGKKSSTLTIWGPAKGQKASTTLVDILVYAPKDYDE